MQKSEGRNRYLLKNTIVFAIGNFGTKLISFFLVPLYTNALVTEQYGTADLIYTIGMVLVPVLTLNLGDSIMRFSLDKNANHNNIMSVGLVSLLIASIVSGLIFPVGKIFAQTQEYTAYIFLYTVTYAFSQMFLCNLRGRELLLQYSIGNIIHSLAIAITNIVLLLGLKKGVEGYLSAYIISNIITAIYAFFAGRVYATFSNFTIDRALCKAMIKYSVVLLPTTFMWWIMNSSDRIMVTAMVGAAANGIYAVAYKVPTMLSTITSVFNQAWSYSAIREEESIDKNEYSNIVYKRLTSIVILVAVGLIMLMKPFLRIYVAKDYYNAWIYTPYLIIGFVFMTLGSFLATSYTVHKDSKGFLFSGTAGAIINLIFNFFLIPLLGVSGAALATCISYIVVFLYRALDVRKYVTLDILNKADIVGFCILIISGACMFIDGWKGQLILGVEFIVVLVLYRDTWLHICLGILKRIRRKNRE